MSNYRRHLILKGSTIREAMVQLNDLAKDAIIFVVDEKDTLIGSLTDGDIRRGLIKGVKIEESVAKVLEPNPKFIKKEEKNLEKIIEYREKNFKILPVLDGNNRIQNVVNFSNTRSYLPLDAVIMAGGKGTRLLPLTETIPKPLVKVGNKAIMEHNLERLILFGIDDFWFSIKYLGDQIKDYFGDGKEKDITINYVLEDKPLGTIGAVSKIDNFRHDYVLITNSDILTNLDYEHFFLDFVNNDADLSIVTIPYQVNIPYAVLETSNGHVLNFKEKPTYTYYSNGGIYLIKKEVLKYLPNETRFDATDLLEKLISMKKKVISYPMSGYWLDIGKHEDYEKAKKDINQIKF